MVFCGGKLLYKHFKNTQVLSESLWQEVTYNVRVHAEIGKDAGSIHPESI